MTDIVIIYGVVALLFIMVVFLGFFFSGNSTININFSKEKKDG